MTAPLVTVSLTAANLAVMALRDQAAHRREEAATSCDFVRTHYEREAQRLEAVADDMFNSMFPGGRA